MSTCISQRGEFSSHEPDADYVCTYCGVLDEDALVDELRQLRGLRTAVQRITDRWQHSAYPTLISDLRSALDAVPASDHDPTDHDKVCDRWEIAGSYGDLRGKVKRIADECAAVEVATAHDLHTIAGDLRAMLENTTAGPSESTHSQDPAPVGHTAADTKDAYRGAHRAAEPCPACGFSDWPVAGQHAARDIHIRDHERGRI